MFDHALLARDLETLNQLDCFNEVTPWGKWRRPSLQQEYTSRFCSMTYMEDKKMQVKDGKRMSRTVLDTDQPPPPHVLDLHPWPLCFSIAELKFLSQSLPRVRPSLQELRFTSPVQDPGYISEILPALEELIRECKELKVLRIRGWKRAQHDVLISCSKFGALKAVFLDDVEVFNSEREDEDSSILFHRHFDPGLEIHDKWPPPIFKRKMEKAHLITTIDVGQNARRHYICPVEFQDFSRCCNLVYCNLKSADLQPSGGEQLADGLSSMPKLQSLILADTKLQARGCMVVVRAAAEHCRALQQLDLSKNGITVKGNDQQWWTEGKRTRDLDSLGGCLGMWKEMRLLSFSKNSLGPLPCRAIFQAIQTWEGDVELRLEDVSIGFLPPIEKEEQERTQGRRIINLMLHLERNDLCNGRLRALLENVLRPLNKRISLHSLSLQHTKLGNEELAVLAHHILDEHQLSSSAHLPLNDPSCASPQCHRGFLELRELDLRLQMSGAQGQVKLAKALRSLQHLTTLDGISTEIMISKQQQEGVEEKLEKEGKGNRNRKVGVERLNFLHTDKLPHGHYQMDFIFMRMRRVHTIIGRLCIRNQDMGKKLSEELAELLPGMNHLRQLDLGFNQLKREGISKIARGLKEVMSGLESLNLEGNAIGPDGAKELVNLWSLKLHRRLKHLNMSSNRLDLEGLVYIFPAFRLSSSAGSKSEMEPESLLETVELNENSLDEAAMDRLGKALKDLPNLTYLSVIHNKIDLYSFESLRRDLSCFCPKIRFFFVHNVQYCACTALPPSRYTIGSLLACRKAIKQHIDMGFEGVYTRSFPPVAMTALTDLLAMPPSEDLLELVRIVGLDDVILAATRSYCLWSKLFAHIVHGKWFRPR